MSPLEAYEALMLFARRRGEGALRLAMHAAVPQSFRPDLLHLLKLNFLPRELHDPAAEADVLFSPLCEEVGRGYFEFGPHVRSLLLDNLAANYATDRTPRIARVANFLLFYVEHAERRAAGGLDRLRRDYLEVQRWVALAFLDPDAAARQLAIALKGTSTPGGEFAARLRLGGLASALSSPLVKYRHVLNYAAGLQALEAGDHARAQDLLASLGDEELEVGGVRLRPASDLLRDYAPPAAEPEEPVPPLSELAGDVPPLAQPPPDSGIPEWIGTLYAARDRGQKITAIQALEKLKAADVPAAAEALTVTVWQDEDNFVRLAAVKALSMSTAETALEALLVAAGDEDAEVRSAAADALADAGVNAVLIFGFFGTDHVENREVLRDELRRRGHVPLVFPLTRPPLRDEAAILRAAAPLTRFAIADLTAPPEILEDLRWQLEHFLLQLTVPLVTISQGDLLSTIPNELRGRHHRVLLHHSYSGPGELRESFDRIITEPVAAMRERREQSEPGEHAPAADPAEAQPEAEFQPAAYDIYISYARMDDEPLSPGQQGWVTQLYERLRVRLEQMLGTRPTFLKDEHTLRGADVLESMDRLSDALLLVVVLSPSYVSSDWCRREVQAFTESAEKRGGLLVGDHSRIFKVVRLPTEDEPEVLREFLGYQFFEYDEARRRPREFRDDVGSDKDHRYWDMLDNLAWDIKRALDKLKHGAGRGGDSEAL